MQEVFNQLLRLLRFNDLKEKGVVKNRVTLHRWMHREIDPFPAPIQLSENSIAWRESEVLDWLARRAKGPLSKPGPPPGPRKKTKATGRGAVQ
jgi:predicted DNA-binding transcriptional regulator AlpA